MSQTKTQLVEGLDLASAPADSLVIDSSGRVGIGTGSPAQVLHVRAASNDIARFESTTTNGSATIELKPQSTSGLARIDVVDNACDFSISTVGKADALVIKNGGNVGVGTTTPGSILHIRKDSSSNTPLSNDWPAVQSGLFVDNQQTGTTGAFSAVTLRAHNSASVAQAASIIVQSAGGSGFSPNLLFTQRTSSGANTERLRIDSSGVATFAGDVRVNGADNTNTALAVDMDASSTNGVTVTSNVSGTDSGQAFGAVDSNGTRTILLRPDGRADFAGDVAIDTNTFFADVSANRVGIGVTSPERRLHVSEASDTRVGIDSTNNSTSGLFLRVLSGGSTVGSSTIRITNTGSLEFWTGTSGDSQRARITEKGEFQMGQNIGSNCTFRQAARDSGNTSETFTSGDMGMGDNWTGLVNISLGGTTSLNHHGGCLVYWTMPRGGSSVIHQTLVTAYKGSGITTFSVSVSGNSLVVSKDSDVGVFVTAIGGGGTSIF